MRIARPHACDVSERGEDGELPRGPDRRRRVLGRKPQPVAKIDGIAHGRAQRALPGSPALLQPVAGSPVLVRRCDTHLDEPLKIVNILGLEVGRRPAAIGRATEPLSSGKASAVAAFCLHRLQNTPSASTLEEENPVAVYNTSEFRKGIKVQIDGDPYLMQHVEFVKPGKGNALYKCKLRNLIKNTMLDRTYRGGDSLEAADVTEIQAQYLYRQGDSFVFMDNVSYEQYELSGEQVDEAWKFLKEGMVCSMTLYNNRPIALTPPPHVVLRVEFCEPAVRGNTATNVTKPVKVETGAEIHCPSFVEIGDLIRVDTRTEEYLERVKE
jgi:elongation factor P